MTLRDLRRKFEQDGHFQAVLHIRMTYFWACNFVAASLVFFLAPGVWSRYSVYYLVIVSLYANFATDYGAVSAAEANENTDSDGEAAA